MRFSASPRLAWFVSGLGVFLTLAVTLIGYRLDTYGYSGEIEVWYGPLLPSASAIAALLVGGLIAARLPGNVYGWIWLLIGIGSGVLQPWGGLLATLALAASPSQIVLGGLATHLTLIGWLFSVCTIPLAILLYPTGGLPSPRWRWVAWLTIAGIITSALVGWAVPGESATAPVINPFGVQGVFGQIARTLSLGAIFSILLVAFPASVLSLALRYRQAQGVQQAQLRWLAFAAAIFLTLFLIDLSNVHLPWLSEEFMTTILDFMPVAFPFMVAVAILRYRLYDIDVIIRKTLIYTSLTILLALVYFGGVVVLQELLAPLTGQGNSPLVIVLTTLGVAALFTPLRRRVQEIIDRRFYRRKYQAEHVLAEFAQTARDEPDLEALTAELERVVRETMQPEQVSLWLKEARR